MVPIAKSWYPDKMKICNTRSPYLPVASFLECIAVCELLQGRVPVPLYEGVVHSLSYEFTRKAKKATTAFLTLTSSYSGHRLHGCSITGLKFSYLSPLKAEQRERHLKDIVCLQNYLDASLPGSHQKQHPCGKTCCNELSWFA